MTLRMYLYVQLSRPCFTDQDPGASKLPLSQRDIPNLGYVPGAGRDQTLENVQLSELRFKHVANVAPT